MKSLFICLLLLVPLGLVAQVESEIPKFMYGTDLISENVAVCRIIPPNNDPNGIYVIQIKPNGNILKLKIGDVRDVLKTDMEVVAVLSAPNDGYKKINNTVINKRANADYDLFMCWQNNKPVEFFDDDLFPSYAEMYSNVIQGPGLIKESRITTSDNQNSGSISSIGIDRFNNLMFIHGITPTTPLQFATTIMDIMPGMRSLMMTEMGPNAAIGFVSGSQYYYSIGNTTYVNTFLFTIR